MTTKTKEFRSMSDLELAERFAKGEELAFNALYEKHHKNLLRFLLSMCNCQSTASDIAQDVWVNMMNLLKEGGFREPYNFQALLLRIGRNRFINLHRQKAGREVVALNDTFDLTDPTPNAERKMALQDTTRILEDAIGNLLPCKWIVPFFLRINGYSYQEIAEILSVRESTCRVRFHQARKLLNGFHHHNNIGQFLS